MDIQCSEDALAQGRSIVLAPAEAIDFEMLAVMQLQHLDGQHGYRMQLEIGGQITNAQLAVTIACGIGQRQQIGLDLFFDIALRRFQLQLGIVAQVQHRQC
ncbi:hypothetical protein D3C85_1474320 [compost metagenome]